MGATNKLEYILVCLCIVRITLIWKSLTFQGSDGGDSEYESADEEELGDEEEEEDDELILMPDGLGVPGEVRAKGEDLRFVLWDAHILMLILINVAVGLWMRKKYIWELFIIL